MLKYNGLKVFLIKHINHLAIHQKQNEIPLIRQIKLLILIDDYCKMKLSHHFIIHI
jgi:hypothetical protein